MPLPHPLTWAILTGGPQKTDAVKQIRAGLTAAEGRVGTWAEAAGLSYATAARLMYSAGLEDFAADLRKKHNHHGPHSARGGIPRGGGRRKRA